MTIQHVRETSALGNRIDETHRPRIYRWAVPAGLVAVAATAVIGVTQYRSDSGDGNPGDLTRSQVLVQDAIDEALAANQAGEFTRAQNTVQDAIDEALAAGRAGAQDTSAVDSANAFEARVADAAQKTPAVDSANRFEQRVADAAQAGRP
jgi:hypothetical protein